MLLTPMALGLLSLPLAALCQTPADPAARLADEIATGLEALGLRPGVPVDATGGVPVSGYHALVTVGEWEERWPDEAGGMRAVPVRAELWRAAIQAALDAHVVVRIPGRPEPYYLDGPLVLRSGQTLLADPDAELRLKPGTNTCLVRNERPVSGWHHPFPEDLRPDVGITLQGGVWTDLATAPGESNGNGQGSVDRQGTVPGSYGVIVFTNVERLVVRDLIVRQSRPFGLHLSNARDFLVENLRFEDHRRDGVHINGPSSYGIVRGISGVTGDDMVALNAWDWQYSTMSFGPIHHVLVQDVTGRALTSPSSGPIPDGSAEIRLLPGNKRLTDGTPVACPLEDIVLRHARAIRGFKMYDQPNLEMGRDNDFSDPIGEMQRIFIRDVETVPGYDALVQVHSNVTGLEVAGVKLEGPMLPDGYAVVSVGPLSMAYPINPQDRSTWVEVFSPDRDCTVRGLSVRDVTYRAPGEPTRSVDPAGLVRVIQQQINPDYPNTVPRGGTGRGYLLP